VSYIVNVSGDDSFIARSRPAITRGLHSLYDGDVLDRYEIADCIRILYKTKKGRELNVVADKSKAFR
jgi:hypothetical protein